MVDLRPYQAAGNDWIEASWARLPLAGRRPAGGYQLPTGGGKTPMQAAIQGSKEIGFAVLAMTFTLAAVFAPIAFTEGRTGKLFAEFALTLASAVIVSGFCALTLSPMMSSKLLQPHQGQGNVIYRFIERFLQALTRGYQAVLTRMLALRWLVLIFAFGAIAAMLMLFRTLPSELSPTEDRGVDRKSTRLNSSHH